jgi:hypothetical protein
MKLTPGQLRAASAIAATDYEVRALLRAYLAGTIDADGFALLAEEIS